MPDMNDQMIELAKEVAALKATTALLAQTGTDGRLRTAEIDLSVIKATALTLKWAGAIVVILLLAAYGYTNFHAIPKAASEAAKEEATRLTSTELAKKIPELQGVAVQTVDQIKQQKQQVDELVSKFKADANTRIGTLQLTSQCVQRSDNSCSPPPPAACQTGYSDTGLILTSVVPGGPCGYGPICRICSKVAPAG